MASVVDVWRAVDPEAALVSGSPSRLGRPVRGVARTRVAPPHLPPPLEGGLLVADVDLLGSVDRLLAALAQADLRPVAVLLAGAGQRTTIEAGDDALPVLASARPVASLADAAAAYLGDESGWLDRLARDLRLACAEAALADPQPATPAGLVASRLRRGVAVSVGGALVALHARPSGRAVAARFAAIHARLFAAGTPRPGGGRSRRDGLWLLERGVRPGASAWVFDDAPLAAVDEVATDALAIILRAIFQRPAPAAGARPAATRERAQQDAGRAELPFAETLLAVARRNGRVAPAARDLGVHRNTVLYRLRRAAAETGLDPRRPDDALAILARGPG